MKRKIIGITIIVIGCCFVLYPIIGNIVNVIRQNNVQAEYNAMVQTLNDETKTTLKSDADDYNKKLAAGDLNVISTDEDSLEENYDDGTGYRSALDIGTGEIAFITIPKIDVRLPIYRGTNPETLEKGIGHLRNTSLPVGGESTHCVLTGHTGLPSAELFTGISKLTEGDLFYIQYLDEIHAYSVDQIKVVEPNDSSDLKIFPGKDYITLLTCYPYGINSHRLLVRGERVPYNGTIEYNNDGTVKGVSATEQAETLDTPAADAGEGSALFDDFTNHTAKVSVYGYHMALGTIIVIVSIVIAAVLAAAAFTVVSIVKQRKRSRNGTEENEQ